MGDNNENNNGNDTERRSFFGGINGRWGSLIILVLLIGAYLIYTSFFANNPDCGGSQPKERLTGVPEPTEYFTGNSAWTANNDDGVNIAMKEFYEKTGIAPYLYDVSTEDVHTKDELQKIADDFYTEHFNDEDHFLLVFQASSDALYAYHTGTATRTILDDATMNLFTKNLQTAFKDKSIKEADVIPYTYITCSDQVMVTPGSNLTFIIIIAAVLIIYGIFNYTRNMKKRSSDDDSGSSGGFGRGIF